MTDSTCSRVSQMGLSQTSRAPASLEAAHEQRDADHDQQARQRHLPEQAVVRPRQVEDGFEEYEPDHKDQKRDDDERATLLDEALIAVAHTLQEQADADATRRDERPNINPARPVARAVLIGEHQADHGQDAARDGRASAQAHEPDDKERQPRDDDEQGPSIGAQVDVDKSDQKEEQADNDEDEDGKR